MTHDPLDEALHDIEKRAVDHDDRPGWKNQTSAERNMYAFQDGAYAFFRLAAVFNPFLRVLLPPEKKDK